MSSGGVAPGGSDLMMGSDTAPTWATAPLSDVPWWKKILTTDSPASDWLSMCSMPLTDVVAARSNCVVMRPAISVGDSPEYDQIAATTGMSMFGKMSVLIRAMVSAPVSAMSSASTTKVY